jgi:hypothetical protein
MATETIEDEGELERALGQAISAWAGIEGALCSIFCQATTAQSRDAAAAAFTAIISFEVQIAVTRAAMDITYSGNKPVWELWSELVKRVDMVRPLRNKLAHGHILVTSGNHGPGTQMRTLSVDFLPFHHFGSHKNTDHYAHWSAADIQRLCAGFVCLSKDLIALNAFMAMGGPRPAISPAPVLKLGRTPAFQRFRSPKPPHP